MKKNIYLLALLVVSLFACSEEKVGQYPVDSIPPSPVTDVQVKQSFGGGVILTYKIPDDLDLLGIKARYTLDTGTKMEVTVSMYATEMKIEGFAKKEKRTVELYAVDRSRNESQPVTVEIVPERSPIFDVYESLEVFDDFGGIQLQWKNPEEKEIILMVSKPITTETDIKESVQNFYTSTKEGIGYVRGFPVGEQTFCFEVCDRWGNKTEMKSGKYNPMYEEEVANTTYWQKWNPTDIPYAQYSSSYPITKLWDGITMQGTATSNFFHLPAGGNFPLRFTFDMRQIYKLSRLKLYQRGDKWVYEHGNPKRFTIYGSLTDKVRLGTDSEFQWIKLGDFESTKPSGMPLGSRTQEDIDKGSGGEDYNFPINLSIPVRYIMFETDETWGGTEMLHISELKFWGEPENK